METCTRRPRISVCVLTCGRKDSLRAVLSTIRNQTLSGHEVIVVDNGSHDGTGEMLRAEFPQVRLLEMARNQGCLARNKAVENALGDIVVGIDDDVFFATRYELERVLRFFQEHPEVHAIDFKILEGAAPQISSQTWCHPTPICESGDLLFETDYIAEGATAFRRNAFLEAGGYPDFFLCHEGYDLAYRMMDRGYRVMYAPQIAVRHFPSSLSRQHARHAYYGTRNHIWLAARNFPLLKVLSYLAYKLPAMFVHSLLRGELGWYLRGLKDGFRSFQRQRAFSLRLRPATLTRLRNLRRQQCFIPSLFRRFATQLRRAAPCS